MNISSQLIPSKFILQVCHLITSIIVLYGRRENIVSHFNVKQLSIESSDYVNADNSIMACTIICFICLAVELLLTIAGPTMFYDVSNFISKQIEFILFFQVVCLHSMGIIVFSLFVLEAWPYGELWIYWAAFIFIPLIMEISAFLFGNILYGTAFSRRQSRKGI